MQDIGRDNPGVQRRAKRIEAGQRKLTIDHRLMRECAAGAAVFFRHRGAEQARLARLVPHIAIVDMRLVPAVEIGNKLVGNEAPRLLLEQDKVLAHPGRARKIDCVHGRLAFANTIRPAGPCGETLATRKLAAGAAKC